MASPAREFFTRFATAVNARDRTALEGMFHSEFTTFSPQTGESTRGFEQFWEQLIGYPGGAPDMPQLPDTTFFGDEDRWAITPSYTVIPLSASNEFTVVDRTVYPDGSTWHTVAIAELRDGLLYRLEIYFAPQMPGPLAETLKPV